MLCLPLDLSFFGLFLINLVCEILKAFLLLSLRTRMFFLFCCNVLLDIMIYERVHQSKKGAYQIELKFEISAC